MAGKAFQSIVPGVLLLAAASGLTALGLSFRATDIAAMAASGGTEPVTIPTFPPATQAEEQATDAFTRPLFHRDRAPGPDKAPAMAAVSDDPSQPAGSSDGSEAPALKGLIIGDKGGRVALQSVNATAPVWLKVGQSVDGWTVEAITARGVRVRSGDEAVEIKFKDDK